MKAILVMDMPENCIDCPCSFFERNNPKLNLICGQTQEDVNGGGKPNWCPLKPMPEKKDICGLYNKEYYDKGGLPPSYKCGWNACIDEIAESMKGEKE